MVRAMLIQNKIEVVTLQHPQEKKKVVTSADLISKVLKNHTLKVGLSWANLSKAIGKEAIAGQWAILYLGSGVPKELTGTVPLDEISVVIKKKQLVPIRSLHIKGIIALDGTWSQAKTLWWRNAWVLKLPRIVLNPKNPSLFGKMRKEPRRECVSTLESVALCLKALDPQSGAYEKLIETFADSLTTL